MTKITPELREELEVKARALVAQHFELHFASDVWDNKLVCIGEMKVQSEMRFEHGDSKNISVKEIREELKQRIYEYVFSSLLAKIISDEI